MLSINSKMTKNNCQVIPMQELKKRKVIEHNDLISSVAKMDKIPLKIFELAVSCIDTYNPPKDNIIYLSKKELFIFFDVSDNDKHSRFKQAIEKMQKQAFFSIREVREKGLEFENIVPIPYIKWNDYDDKVLIEFNCRIMPYLIDLKTNFTQYAISDIVELNSKYSIILYKWLCMSFNQYEHYQYKGNRRQEQLDKYANPIISIHELRRLTNTENEYKQIYDLEKRVLKQPLKEICTHTHFDVTYDKIKKGRSIDSIQFHITKKKVAENEFYKEEEQDAVYLQSKRDREEQQMLLSAQAMQSPYTKFLSEYFIIGFEDFSNIDIMANLQKSVYPLYDRLESSNGLDGVKKHLSYVSEKQEGYSKQNIVKYLKKAIEGYLSKPNFHNN